MRTHAQILSDIARQVADQYRQAPAEETEIEVDLTEPQVHESWLYVLPARFRK